MPIDLSPMLEPARCAVLVFECQEHTIGSGSAIPGLVASVEQGGVLEHIALLLANARRFGAPVFYCNAVGRPTGLGAARTPLTARVKKGGPPPDTSVVKALAPEPGDAVIERPHGMSGFYDSGLDPCLRDLGITTVIPTGVSLNIGVLGTTIEAVNRGYRVIVPTDCCAGDPPEYGDQVLRYSIRNLAYLSTSDAIAGVWGAAP